MPPLDAAKPIREIPTDVCRRLQAVACDIDDTLTTDGRIPEEAFAALWRAQRAGLRVVPVTGRPAGWVDHIARMWPVDGAVGENGAFYFRHVGHRIERRWAKSEADRARDRERLRAVADRILAEVPGAALASDQAYRQFDVAIDYCEDVPRLAPDAVDRIVAIFREEGAAAKVSSIHVNGWFGAWDKLGMLRTLFRDELALDLDAAPDRVIFVGDSPNDEPLFRHFPVSAAVANIADFAERIVDPPAFVASLRGGAGFAEVVDAVLAGRDR